MNSRGIIILMVALGLAGLSGNVVARQATTLKGVLLSPGPLAAAHEKLSDKCTDCHAEFSRKSQSNLCLDCHKTIRADIDAGKRFHGHLKNPDCTWCHSEHLGEKADITGLDMDRFDHSLTAFPLHGRHNSVECVQCHSPARRSENKLPGAYRLARYTCSSCHEDPHQGRLKGECSDCHSEAGWHDSKFDHSHTRFALEGKHRDALCVACHKDQTYRAPVACNACHAAQDVHRGTMGEDCAKCHTSVNWRKVTFDHDTTRFPLGRQHVSVKCTLCHNGRPHQFDTLFAGKTTKPGVCKACHQKDDIHKGSYGAKCGECHRGDSWHAVTFDHEKRTSFALVGLHKQVACAGCHTPGKPVDSARPRRACIDCHQVDDVHRASLGKSCGDCHTVEAAWSDTTFDHDFTSFPITGMHKLLSCNACHATAAFHTTRGKCEQCHQVGKVHEGVFLTQCERCHSTRDWRASQFDHNQTSFPLVGAHKKEGCFDCHNNKLSLSANGNTCFACHAREDVHNGQFGRRCDNCHNQSSFKDVTRTRLR